MASSRLLLLFAAVAVAVACLPAPASAAAWMVGDDGGWRAKFNQTGWADGKTFRVGDTLMFMYTKGAHTVVEVGREDFAACNVRTSNRLGTWNSGNDVVQLDRPGKRWFFCSVAGHCDNGMKLVVDVVGVDVVGDDGVPAPAPEPGW